ncbi:MAG: succinate dehydrogenase, hydrophobic membrane anchor protein [Gammaproteobacteria bacterium]|uniref:succinate dehydrogenase, hydrophobic membrane anchor protein n=1 Tax=Limnobacter sp. TaxID=2003368 RepID=UPI001D478D49|nr:succinate dehydrogenase, hydrophobic membrane anchor protein [Limnobacter sp.]MBU0783459.1 succinate dehydrogenase, hydrophobic membrane anchor protein [Gammaproteobacteria bacterium]MBU0850678.1 succinate dehydrogenase, hydrophobic membrane anchor protein [Gammaproteobacteria bacterium]MBU1266746.1 succinate dehydrogenase, hydrophobic membrane anchor protein [Gammaproteobacteria bacterium]MBU1528742.1 succinate dehydrogenase, hydrophobic membrane anchor protein [Gammaproteobacteria bacteriu
MMGNNIGSKRLVVGAHYGLKEWVAQRITAVIMSLYTIGLFLAVLFTPDIDYVKWVGFFNFTVFSFPLGKMLALLAILSLCYHAYIGIRDIWMDYIKPTGIRLTLQVFTALWLLGAAGYAADILWRV